MNCLYASKSARMLKDAYKFNSNFQKMCQTIVG